MQLEIREIVIMSGTDTRWYQVKVSAPHHRRNLYAPTNAHRLVSLSAVPVVTQITSETKTLLLKKLEFAVLRPQVFYMTDDALPTSVENA